MPSNTTSYASKAQQQLARNGGILSASVSLVLCLLVLSLSGCAGYTSKAEAETGDTPPATTAPVAVFSPAALTFSNIVVGQTSSQTVTVTNTGNANLVITSATMSGSGYGVTGWTQPQTIAPNASTSFSVTFTPTTTATATGSILFSDNATPATQTVTMTGTGTAAAVLGASPSSVNFSTVIVGRTSQTTVTLTNTGGSNLQINSASVSGSAFSMSSLNAQTLTPQQSTSFTVTFAPTASGTANGSVSVVSTAPGSPLTIALTGSGVATQAQIQLAPSPVPFGNVAVGSSGSQTVTLTNTGNATLNITGDTVSSAAYTTTLAATTVNAGANITFSVTFTPTAAGAANGTISITSNAAGSPTSLSLTGTGLQAQIAATPSTVGFGNVVLNSTNSQTIQLRNGGNTTLTFSQISVSGGDFGQTGLSTATTIAAGGTTTFNATFTPTSATAENGSITLTTNGTPSPLVITMSGTGQTATYLLGASPNSLAFGNVTDNSNSTLTSSITNNGNSQVTISGVTVTGTGFSATGISGGTQLNPGQSVTLTVKFQPTTAGAVTGSVSIASNATNSPAAISLTGTGTHAISLQWQASPTGGVTYNLYRGTATGGESTTALNSSPISGLTYSDTNVTAGATYYYIVKAVDSGGTSTASNEASATVPTP